MLGRDRPPSGRRGSVTLSPSCRGLAPARHAHRALPDLAGEVTVPPGRLALRVVAQNALALDGGLGEADRLADARPVDAVAEALLEQLDRLAAVDRAAVATR